MEEKESLRYSYDKPKEERWYWLLLIQIQPIPSNFATWIVSFYCTYYLQYRRAGGKFRTADDFSRVYGLSSEKFNMLKPYIQISEAFRRKQDTLHFIKRRRKIRWRFINIRKEL